MKLLRETIRQLIQESSHSSVGSGPMDRKLAKLLTSVEATVVQGAQLGDSTDMVRDFVLHQVGGTIARVTLKTQPPLAKQISRQVKPWQSLKQKKVRTEDGSDWIESSYAILTY